MNCPVCHKEIASTLSICPSCGAMMNDSVRQELEVKSAPLVKPVNLERKGANLMQHKPNPIKLSEPKPLPLKTITAELPKIAEEPKPAPPSLVEFQNKNATLPDWRLKMQNAARQRLDGQAHEPGETPAPSPRRTQVATSGANALKIEVFEETAVETVPFKNDTVSKALKRIEESRQKFLIQVQPPQPEEIEEQSAQNKNYPFYIAARTNEPAAKPPEKASVNIAPKPKLVTAVRNVSGDLDTNKLPPIQPKPAPMATSFDKPLTIPIPPEFAESRKDEQISAVKLKETIIDESVETSDESEEIDDLAPFAMRFNAGLFDLIIGSFASLIMLAPFMASGGSWFSFSGFLAFAAGTSIVMFIYMTTAIGMFGKTLGMRMFSLELVDIEENAYPTFHQAAVNSSVYLLSLALGGIGFLTIPFTDEKRAVHDIVSGTIVIKED